jgi:SIR2-like domain
VPTLRIENASNVYILGAGFSAEHGLPVVFDFLDTMRDSTGWLDANGLPLEANAVRQVLAFRGSAPAAAYRVRFDPENIEDLFSLRSSLQGPQSSSVEFRHAIAATLRFAEARGVQANSATRIRVGHPVGRGADIGLEWRQPRRADGGRHVHAVSLAEFMIILTGSRAVRPVPGRRDTIITFNYDCLLEKAASDLHLKVNYGLEEYEQPGGTVPFLGAGDDSVRLLKLHGSVNWTTSDGRPDLVRIYPDYKGVIEGESPLLIPPSWQKTFGSPLAKIWDAAVEALSSATRIIAIGYSAPKTDTHFKYLLAAGLLRNEVSLREVVWVNRAERRAMDENLNSLLQVSFIESGRLRYEETTASEFLTRDGQTIDRRLEADLYATVLSPGEDP